MAGTLAAPQALNELGAVNEVLRAAGEGSVSSIEQTNSQAWEAMGIIMNELVSIHTGQHEFNTQLDVKLTPNGDDEIVLPFTTLSITPTGCSRFMRVVERGGRLFDRQGGTFKFTAPVFVNLREVIPFDDAPVPVRVLATVRAAMIYLSRHEPGASSIRDLARMEVKALTDFEVYDASLVPLTQKHTNPHIARLRGHIK